MGATLSVLPAAVRCEPLPAAGGPGARQSAAAVALSETELLLFGGGSAASTEEATQFNDVWVLTLGEGAPAWRLVETRGEAPCARTGHALCRLGGAVVLAGGCSATLGFLADVHVLDTVSWVWSQPEGLGGLFSPRDKLSVTALGGSRCLLFGGFGPSPAGAEAAAAAGAESGSDAGDDEDENEAEEEEEEGGVSFVWHADTFLLERLSGGAWTASAPAVHGEVPSPRAAHGAALLGGRLHVFGGRTAEGRSNDTFSLDTATLTWRRECAAGPSPAGRAQLSFAPLPGVAGVLCFGGLDKDGKALDSLEVLDVRDADSPCWWGCEKGGAGAWPAPRCGAASAMLGSRLVLLGGADGEGRPAGDAVLHCAELAEALRSAGKPAAPAAAA